MGSGVYVEVHMGHGGSRGAMEPGLGAKKTLWFYESQPNCQVPNGHGIGQIRERYQKVRD